jgi:hypothetical protein
MSEMTVKFVPAQLLQVGRGWKRFSGVVIIIVCHR